MDGRAASRGLYRSCIAIYGKGVMQSTHIQRHPQPVIALAVAGGGDLNWTTAQNATIGGDYSNMITASRSPTT
jgi:hypothetical protein